MPPLQNPSPLMICVRTLISPFIMAASLLAQAPENLVVEGIPPLTAELRGNAARYLEFRAAGFIAWNPVRREMLIATRFADTLQLHSVAQPRGRAVKLLSPQSQLEEESLNLKLGASSCLIRIQAAVNSISFTDWI